MKLFSQNHEKKIDKMFTYVMQSSKRYTRSENEILREVFKENEVKMMKTVFLRKIVRRDI